MFDQIYPPGVRQSLGTVNGTPMLGPQSPSPASWVERHPLWTLLIAAVIVYVLLRLLRGTTPLPLALPPTPEVLVSPWNPLP